MFVAGWNYEQNVRKYDPFNDIILVNAEQV